MLRVEYTDIQWDQKLHLPAQRLLAVAHLKISEVEDFVMENKNHFGE
jgi:hypothetical protein